jgi:hypothetical protein
MKWHPFQSRALNPRPCRRDIDLPECCEMTELEGQSGHLTSTAYAAQQQLPHVRSAEKKSAVVAKAAAQGFVSKFNGVSWCKRDTPTLTVSVAVFFCE